jgi:hypothetical protein
MPRALPAELAAHDGKVGGAGVEPATSSAIGH